MVDGNVSVEYVPCKTNKMVLPAVVLLLNANVFAPDGKVEDARLCTNEMVSPVEFHNM